ncbi:MAG TPA: hypothetical protein EYG94_05495 [Campylobacterales bacterium]|nr:hypothetical protein [Campylobacterales bacterium]
MLKLFILTFLASQLLFAGVATVKTTTGQVEVKRQKKTTALNAGDSLHNGDIILTKAKSSIGIMFDDGTRVSLGEKSIFVINKFKVKPSKKEYDVDLELKKGKAIFSSGKIGKLAPEVVKFRIPTGVIGIRGTKFAVEAK